MLVTATDLDGQPLGEIDLVRSADGHAVVNGQAVISTRPIGSRIALVVGATQYCVPLADYWRVIGTSSTEHHSDVV